MDVQCSSEFKEDQTKERLIVTPELREWFAAVPDGASLQAIMWHFGTQRDPEERLAGLRAAWSETRR